MVDILTACWVNSLGKNISDRTKPDEPHMTSNHIKFLFLNFGHFLDHFFMLVFASVATLALTREWHMSYGELIFYATPGLIAFSIFVLPAGWLADKWSRDGMMVIFFIGIGLSSALTALATTPVQIAIGLFAIGMFAAIYHPVGLTLVIQGRQNIGIPIAVNGIYGNLGIACAALITGFMIDHASWRSAFIWPGIISVLAGLGYAWLVFRKTGPESHASRHTPSELGFKRQDLVRIFTIIFVSSALGGIVFQSTTFALPKVFDERLGDLAVSASAIGWYTFLVFAIAGIAQLVVGYMIDRYPVRFVFMVVAGMQALFLGLMPGLNDIAAVVVATIFMAAVFGQIPINDILVGRFSKSEWRATIFATRYIVSFSATASSIPLIAWIHGNWGFTPLFMLLAAIAGVIFLAALMLPLVRVRVVPAD